MKFPKITSKYDNVNTFINTLAPLVCNEWLSRRHKKQKTISPAVVIAQAGLESGWNLKAKTLFGIKGKGAKLNTKEFINGEYISIQDSFKQYPNIASAVQGYYDLMQKANYNDATSATTPEKEVYGLTNAVNNTARDRNGKYVGYNYATSPTYYKDVLKIINNFELTKFNDYVKSVNKAKVKINNTSLKKHDKVKFTGTTDINGTHLKYTNRVFDVYLISEKDNKVLLDYQKQHYAWVKLSEVRKVDD